MKNLTNSMKSHSVLSPIKALAGAVVLVIAASTTSYAAEKLTVLEWSGYDDPAFHTAYTEKHGASPKYSFFADEEEGFQKLRTGFKADLFHPCTNTIRKLQDAKLIKQIDTSRIPAWKNIIPQFLDIPYVQQDGKAWFVPIDWGNTALIYRTDLVDEADAATLQSFVDPKFKGKVTIGDNVDDAYALAFLAIGVTDANNVTDEQFKAASAFLRKVHPNLRTYWSDGSSLDQMLVSGEVMLAWAWNETATRLQGEGKPIGMNKKTKEGVTTWVCGFTLPTTGAASEDKAYDYINAFLSKDSAKYMVETWGYGHANMEGLKTVADDVLKAKGFDNVDAFMKEALFQTITDPALRQKMAAEFAKIKAGF
ncbi:MAG: extracellular solute-binding protein [Hyphomicrobiales bacterium]|nr:extracellular solute-binding protein [Hyphomicrobiales bacterium]